MVFAPWARGDGTAFGSAFRGIRVVWSENPQNDRSTYPQRALA